MAAALSLNVRVDEELVKNIDAWVGKLNAGRLGPQWSRADVIRACLERAVAQHLPKGTTP